MSAVRLYAPLCALLLATITACSHPTPVNIASGDGAPSLATAQHSSAEVLAVIKKELEHSCFAGSTGIGLDTMIRETATKGKYKFETDYYEHLGQDNQVTSYRAKGTCDMTTKTVKLTDLDLKHS